MLSFKSSPKADKQSSGLRPSHNSMNEGQALGKWRYSKDYIKRAENKKRTNYCIFRNLASVMVHLLSY